MGHGSACYEPGGEAGVVIPPPPLPRKVTSSLLVLPQELRDEIYSHVFASTRLTMGRRAFPDGTSHIRIRPAPHSLALLHVCRQITHEIGATWISQVLFNFEDIATMLDKLGSLPPRLRALVRHLRVREGALVRPTHQGNFCFMLGGLMRLLPGLRLDRLTILPCLPRPRHGFPRSHDILAELLTAGSGWKELCFVHHDTGMLAGPRRTRARGSGSSLEAMMISMGFWEDLILDREFRLAQWREMLEERDGNSETTTAAATSPPPTRVGVYSAEDDFTMRPVGSLDDVRRCRCQKRDFVIIARRGRNAAYEETAGAPYEAYPGAADPRATGYGCSWEHLRSFLFHWDYQPESCSSVDRYRYRDEYYVSGPWAGFPW